MRKFLIALSGAAIVLLGASLVARAFVHVAQFVPSPTAKGVFGGGPPWPFFNQINAVNYDLGGNGSAFKHTYNNSNCLAGQSYRSDFTNFNTIADSGAVLDIGCFVTVGDYISWTINISQPGPYVLNMRSGDPAPGASWDAYIDGAKVANIPISPTTASYQSFSTFTSSSFNATQGNHTLRLQCSTLDSDPAHGCGDVVFVQGAQVGNAMQPPAQAAAAGFTTLAYNFDFSLPLYGTQGNWLDCSSSNASVPFWFNIGNCDVSQISDPDTPSIKVMDIHWNNGDPIDNTFAEFIYTFHNSGASAVGTFPNNYAEVTLRAAPSSNTGVPNTGLGSIYTCQVDINGVQVDITAHPAIEVDPGEVWGSNFADAQTGYIGCGGLNSQLAGQWASWDSGTNQFLPSGFSPFAWHKYGSLMTSDGATNVYICNFVDDILQGPGCQPITPAAIVFRQRNLLIMSMQICPGGDGMGGCTYAATPTQDALFKNIHIWSCPSWSGNAGDVAHMCNSPSLAGNPGDRLRYYH